MRGISICVRKTGVQVEQRGARNAMNNRTDIISLYGRIIIINCYYYDVIVIVTHRNLLASSGSMKSVFRYNGC